MAKCKTCDPASEKAMLKSVVKEKKFVDIDAMESSSTTYRVTFDVFPEDLDHVLDEVRAYGSLIKTEMEVIDNG